MIRSLSRSIPAISAFIALALLTACAPAPKVPVLPEEAPGRVLSPAETQTLFSQVRGLNAGLTTFVVSARATLTEEGNAQHFPVSCVGQAPDRLRLVILTPFRQPAETLATDGRHLYIRSHTGRHPFHKTSATGAALKKMLAISLSAEELLSLLAGRPPLRAHDTAYARQLQASQAYELTLKAKGGRLVEKIYLSPDKEVYKVETYTIKGSLAWRAEFSGAYDTEGFRIPKRITVSDADTTLAVTVDRFRGNIDVLPGAFVLKP